MNTKGFAPILIVLLIALGVGGYLLYQKQTKPVTAPQIITQPSPSPVASNETANWKTYTNDTVGYSVKYPESWYVYEHMDGQKNKYLTNIQDIQNPVKLEDTQLGGFGPPGSTIFSILNEPFDNSKGLKVSDWIKENNRYTAVTDESSIMVNNINATIFASTNGNGVHFYVALLPKSQKIYEIALIGTKENKELLSKILSTFKFTN